MPLENMCRATMDSVIGHRISERFWRDCIFSMILVLAAFGGMSSSEIIQFLICFGQSLTKKENC